MLTDSVGTAGSGSVQMARIACIDMHYHLDLC